VNVVECQVEVHLHPAGDDYQSRSDYRPGQVFPVIIGGNGVGEIAVDDIFQLANGVASAGD
jgi:hypothetical protein